MAGSYGNRHILKESEVEAMKKAGTWSNWLRCAFSMAECHPAAGEFEVTIVDDEGRNGDSPARKLLDLASLAELQGVSVCAAC